jgi:hypothetical protein
MDLHRFWDGVITSSSNVTRLRNEATALRNRREFQRSQLTELASTDFESWAKECFDIATKIAYRNGGRIGGPRGGNMNCMMVAAAPVLPGSYVVRARRIANRRMILGIPLGGSSNVGKGWVFAVRPARPTALEQSHTPGRRQQHDRYHNYGWINGLNNGPHCICLHYQPPFHDEAAPMNAQIGPGHIKRASRL